MQSSSDTPCPASTQVPSDQRSRLSRLLAAILLAAGLPLAAAAAESATPDNPELGRALETLRSDYQQRLDSVAVPGGDGVGAAAGRAAAEAQRERINSSYQAARDATIQKFQSRTPGTTGSPRATDPYRQVDGILSDMGRRAQRRQAAVAQIDEGLEHRKAGRYLPAMAAFWRAKELGKGGEACYLVAQLYLEGGADLTRNTNRALEYLTESSAPEAKLLLAKFHTEGVHVPPSKRQAFDLTEEADNLASGQCAPALLAIAESFRDGAFRATNHPTAARHYWRAAWLGAKAAQWTVGNIYLTGDGLKQNNIQAYRWFTLASQTTANEKDLIDYHAAQPYRCTNLALSPDQLAAASSNLTVLRARMSPSDLLMADRLVEETRRIDAKRPSLTARRRDPLGTLGRGEPNPSDDERQVLDAVRRQ